MPDQPRFSHLFHQLSKTDRGNVPLDQNKWPDSWKTQEYKTYDRFPKIPLDTTESSESLFSLLLRRQSRYDFARQSLDKKKLSTLLFYACGKKQNSWHRMYPSAGGLFPLEFYIIVFVSGPEIPSGVYHYKVLNHELEVLLQKDFTESDMGELFRDIGAVKAGFAIITSACFERTQRKYSERGYRNILLEAGHVGQNILLCAESLEIKACPIAGTKDENIEKLLDIDGVTESLVHAFLFD